MVGLSLALHIWLVVDTRWQPERIDDDSGSAGRAALAIGDIRFQQTLTKALPLDVNRAPAERQPQKPEQSTNEPVVVVDVEVPPVEIEIITDQDITEARRINEYVVGSEQEESPKPISADTSMSEQVTTNTDVEAEYAGFDRIPLMEEPRYQKAFPPDYPRLARKRGYQGVVTVRAKVGVDGHVQSVELKVSSGYDSLDNSALDAVTQWQFHPYRIHDQLTVAWVEIPVEFILNR